MNFKLIKKINIVIVLVCCITNTMAQCSNDETTYTPSTDWRISGGINNFDWTATTYNTYINQGGTNSVNIQIASPFYNPNSPGPSHNKNLLPFYLAKSATGSNASIDYHPEDGWELIINDFGKSGVAANGVANPVLVLYNKYTSKLRVFVCKMDKTSGFNSALIKLEIGGTSVQTRKSAIFSFANSITKALDKFDVNQTMSSTNFYENDENQYWLYADFPIAYDPCTCNYPSLLTINYMLVSQAHIDLVSKITGDLVEKNVENGEKKASADLISPDQFIEGLLKGIEVYKSFDGLETDKDKLLENYNTATKENVNNSFVKLFEYFAGSLVESEALPELGTAVSLFNFFAFGGKKTEDASQTLTAFAADLKINTVGSITSQTPQSSSTFWNPGSNRSATDLKPKWDNILGVVNLMKAPILDVYTYIPLTGSKHCETAQNQDGNDLGTTDFSFSKIKEYRIKEDISLAFNKASGLDILSVEAALVFNQVHDNYSLNGGVYKNTKRFYGPVETIKPWEYGNDFTERMNNIGLEIENWPNNDGKIDYVTYRTAYRPISCFKGTYFRVFYNDDNYASFRKIDEVYVKLKCVFKRKDNPNAEPVVMLISYNPEINELGAEDRTFKISSVINGEVHHQYISCNLWENYIESLSNVPAGIGITAPVNLTITNQNITSNLKAFKTITIGPNVSIAGNLEIRAGVKINVIQPVTIDPTSKLIRGFVDASCEPSANTLIVSNDDLNAFCANNSAYETKTQGFIAEKDKNPVIDNTFNDIELNCLIYPNPNSGNFSVSIDDASNNWEISLSDITGKLILTQKFNKGQYIANIETHNLTSGIYLVTVKANDKERTEKLILQNN